MAVAAALSSDGIYIEPVAICLPRGYQQIVAALGIVISGNCYVPVSQNQPQDRIRLIWEKTGIHYIITDKMHSEEMDIGMGTELFLFEKMLQQEPIESQVQINPEDTAYIIMTSGSTGLPKGVEIAHGSAMNTLDDINQRLEITEKDILLAVSAMDFDLSVFDTFAILGQGGTSVLIPEDKSKDAEFWLQLIEEYRITIWNSVPILLDMLLITMEGKNRTLPLRAVMLSGDWIGLDLPARVQAITDNCRFIAMGGATEASIWSNMIEVLLPLPKEWKSIPYGRPLANQDYRIVDENGQDCPTWVEGELWIGGCGVAKGYRGDEQLTKDKFIQDERGRWYRTGDKGRFWKDGTIEFLGRRDYQVKIRGHRIELGEIEAAARQMENVKDTVAVIAEAESTNKSIVLYVVWEKEERIDSDCLKEYLQEKLPEYMIPRFYITMEEIPLTANGKVDRKHLPPLYLHKYPKESAVIFTKTEKALSKIWEKVFSIKALDRQDNFFDIGGDSLVATKICAQIQSTMKVKVTIRDIFENPVLQNLAKAVNRLQSKAKQKIDELPQIIAEPERKYHPFPLTNIQYSYWIGRKGLYPLGDVSSHCFFEIEKEDLDITRVNKAFSD